jgi:hypothetical protein
LFLAEAPAVKERPVGGVGGAGKPDDKCGRDRKKRPGARIRATDAK